MKATAISVLTLALCLVGCVNFKPKPDRTQVFALASEVPVAADLEGKPEVHVDRVELPGFLEGTRIHFRTANGELNSFAGARWAQDPAEALPRAIAMHLQSTGRANVRGYYPWAYTQPEAAKISVQFERFSANPAGQVEVVAQWQIESADGRRTQGRYIAPGLQWDGGDVADYVAKLNQGLAGLAEKIAQAL